MQFQLHRGIQSDKCSLLNYVEDVFVECVFFIFFIVFVGVKTLIPCRSPPRANVSSVVDEIKAGHKTLHRQI